MCRGLQYPTSRYARADALYRAKWHNRHKEGLLEYPCRTASTTQNAATISRLCEALFVRIRSNMFLRDAIEEKQVNSQYSRTLQCEPLIDAKRAGILLKFHPKTVKRLAKEGVLPGIKIGRVWRFRESSLDAWMTAQLQYSGHPSPKGESFQ